MAIELPLCHIILAAQTLLFFAQQLFSRRINSVALNALSYFTAIEGVQTAGRILSNIYRNNKSDATYSYGNVRLGVLFEFSGMAVVSMMCVSVAFEAFLRLNFASVFTDIVVNAQERMFEIFCRQPALPIPQPASDVSCV
mmetsp:Transcript_28648/g.75394  ORF Transcript_28648/g.75394 Transcript_28648/m.75394 type:complete len:140 (+) Transcript_28648:59-478(+)